MIKFCHISPTKYLKQFTSRNGAHLLLAHLVEEDQQYRDYYANLKDGKPKILDNSAFELFKRGLPMFPSDKLIDLGKAVSADYLVLSDYPGDPSSKTIEAAKELIPKFKQAGFLTFFVPQSKIGDEDDYIAGMKWAISNSNIDLIGLSILGIPNAYGVEKDNKLQRYNSRFHMLRQIEPFLDPLLDVDRFHCLGMVDGPNEISLMKPFHKYIYSWDSSSAVWAGIHGITYDNSPTGLMEGKFETEVDFGLQDDLTALQVDLVHHNIEHIQGQL